MEEQTSKLIVGVILGPSYTHADIHYLGFHGTKLFVEQMVEYMFRKTMELIYRFNCWAQISQFYKISVAKQSSAKHGWRFTR